MVKLHEVARDAEDGSAATGRSHHIPLKQNPDPARWGNSKRRRSLSTSQFVKIRSAAKRDMNVYKRMSESVEDEKCWREDGAVVTNGVVGQDDTDTSPATGEAVSDTAYKRESINITSNPPLSAADHCRLYYTDNTANVRCHQGNSLDVNRELDYPGSSGSFCSSAVRVDITDLDGSLANPTTSVLNQCKKLVLTPYWRLLTLICWRAFGADKVNNAGRWKVINTCYAICIFMLIFYSYTYNILACQGKLTLEGQLMPSVVTVWPSTPRHTTAQTTTHSSNFTTTTSYPWESIDPLPEEHSTPGYNDTQIAPITEVISPQCYHITTTYIIPSVLHFMAFIGGIFYFRIQNNEHLYALMEKVFLLSSPLQATSSGMDQAMLLRNLRIFLAVSIWWLLAGVIGQQVLFALAFGIAGTQESHFRMNNITTIDSEPILYFRNATVIPYVLFSFEVLGTLLLNLVYIAVVMNYVTQCELILFYMSSIINKLREKSIELKAAQQDMLHVKQCISRMNGPTAKMTALCNINFTQMFVTGMCILMFNQYDDPYIWAYRSVFPAVYLIILMLSLVQAARVTKKGGKFAQIGLEIRVFGYKQASQLELDSFLHFVTAVDYRAKLFSIPIKISYLVAITVITFFSLLIFLQMDIITTDATHFL